MERQGAEHTYHLSPWICAIDIRESVERADECNICDGGRVDRGDRDVVRWNASLDNDSPWLTCSEIPRVVGADGERWRSRLRDNATSGLPVCSKK